MQEILLKVRYFDIFKEDYRKACKRIIKKVTLFFLWNPVPFNEKNCQKQAEPGTSDQFFFSLQNKFRKFPLLIMYYLTKLND